MPITYEEHIQVKSKEIHSRNYKLSIGHVDMDRYGCYELTSHKNKTNIKILVIYSI